MTKPDDFDALIYAIDKYLFTKSAVEEWRLRHGGESSPEAVEAVERQKIYAKEAIDNYLCRKVKQFFQDELCFHQDLLKNRDNQK